VIVYLTRPTSMTAHPDPYCGFLVRRANYCPLHALRAQPSVLDGWVEWEHRGKPRRGKLCSYCGRLLGVQTSLDESVPEEPMYGRRRNG